MDAPRRERPRELVYTARHVASNRLGPSLPLLLVGGGACAGLVAYGQSAAGVVSLAGVMALEAWRRARRASGVVLRVEGAMLLVYPWRGARKASAVSLLDLHDVCLDTKTIHKEQRETRAGVYAFTGTTASMAVDVSRITFVLADGVEPIELTGDFASHSETVEQIAKMKTFLRTCGWLPRDEREAPASE